MITVDQMRAKFPTRDSLRSKCLLLNAAADEKASSATDFKIRNNKTYWFAKEDMEAGLNEQNQLGWFPESLDSFRRVAEVEAIVVELSRRHPV